MGLRGRRTSILFPRSRCRDRASSAVSETARCPCSSPPSDSSAYPSPSARLEVRRPAWKPSTYPSPPPPPGSRRPARLRRPCLEVVGLLLSAAPLGSLPTPLCSNCPPPALRPIGRCSLSSHFSLLCADVLCTCALSSHFSLALALLVADQ